MRKGHRAITALVIAFCFVTALISPAGAATFPDVSGSGAEAAAIYKLNGLGIIEGYPDGTFGANRTITRAEFAKIACSIAGLAKVSGGMTGTVSSFNDVTTAHWANGYINVAAAQGYMKGYPDGSFQPEDSITQAEVVTVLLRLLGYNDNLPGEWPSDYVAKAANLGILDDITFVAGRDATRGEVAILGSAALDENVVQYVASDNYFEEKIKNGDPFTLLTQNFDGSRHLEDMLVTDVDLSGGDIRITVFGDLDNDKKTAPKAISYDLAKNCVIGGNNSWYNILYRFIDFTVDNDKKIIGIILKDYKVYQMDPGDVETKTVDKDGVTSLKLDGKKIECADEVQMIMSDDEKDIFTDKKNIGVDMDELLAADTIDLVCNDDGDIALIKVNAYTATKDPDHGIAKVGIVDTVNMKSGKIVFKNTGSIDLDEDDDETYMIIRDGKIASLKDLDEDDLIFDYTDDSGLDITYNYGLEHFLVVSSKTVSGDFEELETTGSGNDLLKSVTVDDDDYDVPGGYSKRDYLFSDDEGDSFDLENDYEAAESVLGEEVTIWLSPTGKAVAIAAGSGSGGSGRIYGVINDDDVSTLVNGKITDAIEILLPDDSFATYAPDEDSEVWDPAQKKYVTLKKSHIGSGQILCIDTLVQLTLSSDGYIDQICRVADLDANVAFEYAASEKVTIYGDEDNKTITIKNQSYDMSKAVIFNTSLKADIDGDEVAVVSRSEFLDRADSTITDAGHVVAKIKSGEIQYLVLDNEDVLGSDNNVAMVTGSGTNADGKYVKLITTGKEVKYTVKSGDIPKKGQVMNYKLVSGKVVNKEFSGWKYDGDEMTVERVSGNIFRIDGVNYAVNKDTLYFDFTDKDPVVAEKGDFAAGDAVEVYQEKADDALAAIVLVDATSASTQVAAPTASPDAGAVTSGSTVTLSTTTNGATIYYTTDGTMPTTSSTQYTGAITINSDVTIKAFAVKADKKNSSVATFAYTIAPAVTGVSVSPTTASVVQGGTQQLNAVADVVGGAAQTVTWSSSDNSGKVSVSTDGLVSVAANAPTGNYTITATSTVDGSKSGAATITVTVAPGVTSVSVLPATASVVRGGTQQLTATVVVVGGAAQTVTWSSSDIINKVSVSTDGLVSVAADAVPGDYTITATSTVDGSKSGAATVTVPGVTSVSVLPTTASVARGGTQQLTATVVVVGGAAQTVMWSSSDITNKVSVSTDGLVSVAVDAVPGDYTITATSTVDGSKSGAATVTVPGVTSVSVLPATASVARGGTQQLTATVVVVGGAAQTVTWSSSDITNKVSVSTDGLVSVAADAPTGNYTITATSTVDGSKSGTATITVTIP